MRSSVINNERGSVINGKRDSTNDYDYSNIIERNEDEKVGGGDSAPLTPTLSLLNTLNTLLITYLSFIVFITSQTIQHNIVPNNVANNINPTSII